MRSRTFGYGHWCMDHSSYRNKWETRQVCYFFYLAIIPTINPIPPPRTFFMQRNKPNHPSRPRVGRHHAILSWWLVMAWAQPLSHFLVHFTSISMAYRMTMKCPWIQYVVVFSGVCVCVQHTFSGTCVSAQTQFYGSIDSCWPVSNKKLIHVGYRQCCGCHSIQLWSQDIQWSHRR